MLRMIPSNNPGRGRGWLSPEGREATNTAPQREDFAYPVYRDWDRIPLEYVMQLQSSQNEEMKGKGGKKSTFPSRLYDLLANAEALGYADIVSWRPHGRSFMVKNKKRFVAEVAPRYFGSQNEFASFQRQLNVYGFLRMTRRGPDRASYYHELFLRGRPDLVAVMPRKRSTTASVRRSLDPLTEPDLYNLPPSLADAKPGAAVSLPGITNSAVMPQLSAGMMAGSMPVHIDPRAQHGFPSLVAASFPSHIHPAIFSTTERIPNMALSMGSQPYVAADILRLRHTDTASLPAQSGTDTSGRSVSEREVPPAGTASSTDASANPTHAASLHTKGSSSSEEMEVNMSEKDVADMVHFLSDVDL